MQCQYRLTSKYRVVTCRKKSYYEFHASGDVDDSDTLLVCAEHLPDMLEQIKGSAAVYLTN